MLRTELTRLLGLQYPIVQAPMAGGPTTPDLVAEVSAAGGLGVYAGSGVPPDLLVASIAAIRSRTTAPFGVNFLIAPPESGGDIEASVQSVLDRLRTELGLPRQAPVTSSFPPRSSRSRSTSCSRSASRC